MLKRSINHNKLKFLFISMAIFSIVYLIFDDNNFSGVNYIKEKVKDEVFKKKVEKNIKKETDKEGFSEVNDLETKIDETVKSAKNEIEQDELIDEKMNASLGQKLFNRIYFSISTPGDFIDYHASRLDGIRNGKNSRGGHRCRGRKHSHCRGGHRCGGQNHGNCRGRSGWRYSRWQRGGGIGDDTSRGRQRRVGRILRW